jgi:general secretion pathway protein G
MSRRPITGFTLIELVITVAIVGLLSTLAVPMAELAVKRVKEQELRWNLREIRTAIDAYKQAVEDGRIIITLDQSGYPPTLKTLVDGVDDASSPDDKKTKIYFLRRIPRDPMDPDTSKAPEDTWGKRSYASPPDAPEEGDDVFDVYALSQDAGINGIPYKDW